MFEGQQAAGRRRRLYVDAVHTDVRRHSCSNGVAAGLKQKIVTMKGLVEVVEQRQTQASTELEGLQLERSNLCTFPAETLEDWEPRVTPGAALFLPCRRCAPLRALHNRLWASEHCRRSQTAAVLLAQYVDHSAPGPGVKSKPVGLNKLGSASIAGKRTHHDESC